MMAVAVAPRTFRLIVSAIFVTILVLPCLQMLTGRPRISPLNENRTLAAPPTLNQVAKPAAALAQAQLWFAEHYGFRPLLIRSKTQIDYSLFGISDKIHIGRDGWLFYRSEIDEEEPAIQRLTDAEIATALAKVARLRDILLARNIQLVILTNQMKDKFYPEFLPYAAWKARTNHQRFDEFRTLLRSVPGISYIDTTPLLTALKQRGPIFHKTDFHWTDPAAAHFAEILVNTIAAKEGKSLPFWRNHMEEYVWKFYGGQTMFMPLLYQPKEKGIWLRRTGLAPWEFALGEYPFETVWRAKPGVDNLLPPMVLFGDSFADGMDRAGLYDSFEQSLRARLLKAKLTDVLAAMPQDTQYFIFSFIELRLRDFIDMPIE